MALGLVRPRAGSAAAAAVSSTELVEAARVSPELLEIVHFVLGEEYLALRRQLA